MNPRHCCYFDESIGKVIHKYPVGLLCENNLCYCKLQNVDQREVKTGFAVASTFAGKGGKIK